MIVTCRDFWWRGDLKCQHHFFAQNIEASIIHPKIYPPPISIHPYILNINTYTWNKKDHPLLNSHSFVAVFHGLTFLECFHCWKDSNFCSFSQLLNCHKVFLKKIEVRQFQESRQKNNTWHGVVAAYSGQKMKKIAQ